MTRRDWIILAALIALAAFGPSIVMAIVWQAL